MNRPVKSEYYFEDKYSGTSVFYFPFPKPFFYISDDVHTALKKSLNLTLEEYKKLYEKSIKSLIENKDKEVRLVYLLLTDVCNFRCKYCYIERKFNYEGNRMMPFEVAKKALDFLFNKFPKINKIILYGGEPLLNKDFRKIVEYIRKKKENIKIDMISNGSIFSEKIAEFIKKQKINIGFSLDGWKEINDSNRVYFNPENNKLEGTYNLVTENIRRYTQAGIPTSLSVTITRESVPYLCDIAYFFADKIHVNSIGFNIPLVKESNHFFDIVAEQVVNARYVLHKYNIYEDRVGRRLSKINKDVFIQDCAGYGNQIVVAPDGKLNYCQAYYKFENPFTPWQDMENYNDNYRNKWNDLLIDHFKRCDGCPFISICGKGCAFHSRMYGSEENIDYSTCALVNRMIKDISFELVKDIKWIVFDFDHLIILRENLSNILKHLIEKFNLPKDIFDNNLSWRHLEKVRVPLKERGIDDEEILNEYARIFYGSARLNTELIEVIKELRKKYKIGIFSGGSREHLIKEISRFKIGDYFDKILGDDKSTPEAYLKILDYFNVKRNEVVFITHSLSELSKTLQVGIKTYVVNKYPKWLLKIF